MVQQLGEPIDKMRQDTIGAHSRHMPWTQAWPPSHILRFGGTCFSQSPTNIELASEDAYFSTILDKIWNIMIWINDHDVPVQQPESMRQFSLGSLPILILSMKNTNPQIPVNETRSESAYCSPRQSNGIRFESLSIQTSTLSRGAAYKSTPMCDKAGPFFPVWVFPTLVMRVLAGITLGQFHIVNWPCS